MGFPLYSWPLMASVMHLGCPDGQGPCSSTGSEGQSDVVPLISDDRPGSTLLVARWLPRGRYLVTLSQQALKIGAAESDGDEEGDGARDSTDGDARGIKHRPVCERFSFRLVLETVSKTSASEDHLGQHIVRLPHSLDGVPFLKFGGRAHVWGRFAMAHPGVSLPLIPS